MRLIAMMAGLAGTGLLASACTTGVDRGPAGRANAAGTVVAITPQIRAEILRQGHDPDEKICKREEPTGSTIPRNICATRAAWAAKTQASKDYTRDAQGSGLRNRDPKAGTT